jgi:hypothetical protein
MPPAFGLLNHLPVSAPAMDLHCNPRWNLSGTALMEFREVDSTQRDACIPGGIDGPSTQGAPK